MIMPKLFLSMQNIFRSKPFDIIVHGYKSESLQINMYDFTSVGLRRWLSSKDSSWNAGVTEDLVLIPGSGRFPAGGHDNSVHYSCLENAMDRGAWWPRPLGCKEMDMIEAT